MPQTQHVQSSPAEKAQIETIPAETAPAETAPADTDLGLIKSFSHLRAMQKETNRTQT